MIVEAQNTLDYRFRIMKSAIVLVVLIAAVTLGDAFITNSKETLSRERRFINGHLGVNGLLGINIGRTSTASPAVDEAQSEAEQSETTNKGPLLGLDVDLGPLGGGGISVGGGNNRPLLDANLNLFRKETLSRERRFIKGQLDVTIPNIISVGVGIGRTTTASPAADASLPESAPPSAPETPTQEPEPISPNNPSDANESSQSSQQTDSSSQSSSTNKRPLLGLGLNGPLGGLNISVGK